MMASSAQGDRATWNAPQCPFSISYPLRVLDDIRLAVMDAFFSLPRGGAEIGGLLLGNFEREQVVISGYVPLDAEHAFGPSFTLSPRDEAQLTELIRLHEGRVAGWYHSHTRSEIFLTDADQALHRRFFPEPWQVALVLKPHTFQPMRGGFFFREDGDVIHGESSYQEFPLEALPLRPVPKGELPAEPARSQVDTNFEGRVINIEAISATPETPPEAVQAAAPAVAADLPKFALVEPQKSRRWWIASLCVLLGSAMGAWAYQTRNLWLPAPAASPAASAASYLALSADEQNGELQIRWDRNSPAVRSGLSAVLTITDGDAARSVPLDREHLLSGSLTYIRKTERVDLSMTLQQPGGPLREATQFQGKLAAAPQDQALQQRLNDLIGQNNQLKADLVRQAERARKAEVALEDLRKVSQRKRLGNQVPDIVK